jgi:hypothetical protein
MNISQLASHVARTLRAPFGKWDVRPDFGNLVAIVLEQAEQIKRLERRSAWAEDCIRLIADHKTGEVEPLTNRDVFELDPFEDPDQALLPFIDESHHTRIEALPQ